MAHVRVLRYGQGKWQQRHQQCKVDRRHLDGRYYTRVLWAYAGETTEKVFFTAAVYFLDGVVSDRGVLMLRAARWKPTRAVSECSWSTKDRRNVMSDCSVSTSDNCVDGWQQDDDNDEVKKKKKKKKKKKRRRERREGSVGKRRRVE